MKFVKMEFDNSLMQEFLRKLKVEKEVNRFVR